MTAVHTGTAWTRRPGGAVEEQRSRPPRLPGPTGLVCQAVALSAFLRGGSASAVTAKAGAVTAGGGQEGLRKRRGGIGAVHRHVSASGPDTPAQPAARPARGALWHHHPRPPPQQHRAAPGGRRWYLGTALPGSGAGPGRLDRGHDASARRTGQDVPPVDAGTLPPAGRSRTLRLQWSARSACFEGRPPRSDWATGGGSAWPGPDRS